MALERRRGGGGRDRSRARRRHSRRARARSVVRRATVHTRIGVHETTTERRRARSAAFQDAMQRLWVDHVTWTRLFIVSFVADLPDLQATTDRLLQNQVDIGDAVKPFYGDAAGRPADGLLEEHILTAADLLDRCEGRRRCGVRPRPTTAWYANAQGDREVPARGEPASTGRSLTCASMMKDHLDLTLAGSGRPTRR